MSAATQRLQLLDLTPSSLGTYMSNPGEGGSPSCAR